jgi:drug/metabolite transporter (DMT)-like permease
MLFELVIAALSAWWLTDERLSSLEWLGGSLILLAGYLLVRHSEAKSA